MGAGSISVLYSICLGVMKKKVELQDGYREPFSELLSQHAHLPAHDLRLPHSHVPLLQAVARGFPAVVCLVTEHTHVRDALEAQVTINVLTKTPRLVVQPT